MLQSNDASIRSSLTSRIDGYVSVLRENCTKYQDSSMRKRLHCLLGCLVSQGLYHRDITDCESSVLVPEIRLCHWKFVHHILLSSLVGLLV